MLRVAGGEVVFCILVFLKTKVVGVALATTESALFVSCEKVQTADITIDGKAIGNVIVLWLFGGTALVVPPCTIHPLGNLKYPGVALNCKN